MTRYYALLRFAFHILYGENTKFTPHAQQQSYSEALRNVCISNEPFLIKPFAQAHTKEKKMLLSFDSGSYNEKKIKCYQFWCVGVFLSDAINTTYIT